jgi:hypothetical protein
VRLLNKQTNNHIIKYYISHHTNASYMLDTEANLQDVNSILSDSSSNNVLIFWLLVASGRLRTSSYLCTAVFLTSSWSNRLCVALPKSLCGSNFCFGSKRLKNQSRLQRRLTVVLKLQKIDFSCISFLLLFMLLLLLLIRYDPSVELSKGTA